MGLNVYYCTFPPTSEHLQYIAIYCNQNYACSIALKASMHLQNCGKLNMRRKRCNLLISFKKMTPQSLHLSWELSTQWEKCAWAGIRFHRQQGRPRKLNYIIKSRTLTIHKNCLSLTYYCHPFSVWQYVIWLVRSSFAWGIQSKSCAVSSVSETEPAPLKCWVLVLLLVKPQDLHQPGTPPKPSLVRTAEQHEQLISKLTLPRLWSFHMMLYTTRRFRSSAGTPLVWISSPGMQAV